MTEYQENDLICSDEDWNMKAELFLTKEIVSEQLYYMVMYSRKGEMKIRKRLLVSVERATSSFSNSVHHEPSLYCKSMQTG